MRAIRYSLPVVLLTTVMMLVIMSPFAVGCGSSGPSARDKTISATYITIKAAGSAFAAYDLEHQRELLASSKTKEEAEAKTKAYQTTQQAKILALLQAAYDAARDAAFINNDQSLAALVQAALDLQQAVKDLKKANSP